MTSLFPQLTPSGLRFFVKKIANSKKEVQVSLIDNSVESYESGFFKLFNPKTGLESSGKTNINQIFNALKNVTTATITNPEFELVISVGKGKYIPILNALFTVDTTKSSLNVNAYHMVFKTNEPLPPEIKKLKTIEVLIIKSEYLKQDIFYGGKRPPIIKKFGNPLETDLSVTSIGQGERNTEDFKNYNELTGSIGEDHLLSNLSSSYQDRLVNYSNFNNFVYFSSAKKRIENFKDKVAEIESYQVNISKSLYSPGQSDPDTSELSSSLASQHQTATAIRGRYFNEIWIN